MAEIQVMSLAAQKAEWLSMRQAILAQNVANANTPNFQAKDIVPFDTFLDNAQVSMAASNGRHMNISGGASDRTKVEQVRSTESSFSGNSVSIENELLKLGETNSEFVLSTTLIKTFNRMIMASFKA